MTNTIGHVALKKSFNEIDFQSEEYLKLTKLFDKKSVGDIEEIVKHTIKEMEMIPMVAVILTENLPPF